MFNSLCSFQVNDIRRPSQYEGAIRQKERAREDIVVSDKYIYTSLDKLNFLVYNIWNETNHIYLQEIY